MGRSVWCEAAERREMASLGRRVVSLFAESSLPSPSSPPFSSSLSLQLPPLLLTLSKLSCRLFAVMKLLVQDKDVLPDTLLAHALMLSPA